MLRILCSSTLFLLLILRPSSGVALDEQQTLTLLVSTLQRIDDESVRLSLMKGMLRGLEGRREVGTPDGWSDLTKELATATNQDLQRVANRLSQIFGDQEAAKRSIALLNNTNASVEQRQEALQSLVSQRHPGLAAMLPALLEDKTLTLNVIRAFGVVENQSAPAILLSIYRDAPEEQQRAIVETLASRKSYARDLVAALKQGVVQRDRIPPYTARSLRDLLGPTFTNVYGEIPQLTKDTAQVIAKYKKLITPSRLAEADASRGRAVFEKTCGACHMMYGQGGKIGPDLTGSNRANLDYLLLNSVDPSGDVPEGYRTLMVQTVDGRVLTGVLAEEDKQRLVLKTVDQPRLVIAKEDIEARKVSEKSMMPDGQLDLLKREQLFDLVKYMQTTMQVETVK